MTSVPISAAAVRGDLVDRVFPPALEALKPGLEVALRYGHYGASLPRRVVLVGPVSGLEHTDATLGGRVRGSIQEEYDLHVNVVTIAGGTKGGRTSAEDALTIACALDDAIRADRHLAAGPAPVRDIVLSKAEEVLDFVTEGHYCEWSLTFHVSVRV